MEWTGGCLCGAVRYAARAAPLRVVSCHCAHLPAGLRRRVPDLRPFSGGRVRVDPRRAARYRSSAEAERGFCPVCGSTLSMHEAVLADRVQVSLGSLDRPDLVRPDDHVWTSSQLPWLELVDDRPRFATTSDAVPSRALDGDDGG